jgi:hypothetical protein
MSLKVKTLEGMHRSTQFSRLELRHLCDVTVKTSATVTLDFFERLHSSQNGDSGIRPRQCLSCGSQRGKNSQIAARMRALAAKPGSGTFLADHP